jgi:hypothetical protein
MKSSPKHIFLKIAAYCPLYKIQSLFLKPPVFVTGCGHSGTSIMIRVLGSHSKIFPVRGESGTFTPKKNEVKRFLRILKHLFLFNKETLLSNKRRWVEKTPKHILEIGRIFRYIPNAKIIIMARDGRDVACSIKERTGNLDDGITRWVEDNEAALSFHNHPQVKVVIYEEFAKHPDSVMRDIMSFLGEEYEETLFNTDKIEWITTGVHMSTHNARRIDQLKKPIYDGSGRWKKEMTEPELKRFLDKGRNLMVGFGYLDKADPPRS